MFSNQDLKKMIIPLFFEQLLIMLVGIADTFIVSYVGESAVSGVSLVNSFNTIFIYLFTALASGGAVVISQYLGHDDQKNTVKSSSQLLMFSFVFSCQPHLYIETDCRILCSSPVIRQLFLIERKLQPLPATVFRLSVQFHPMLPGLLPFLHLRTGCHPGA